MSDELNFSDGYIDDTVTSDDDEEGCFMSDACNDTSINQPVLTDNDFDDIYDKYSFEQNDESEYDESTNKAKKSIKENIDDYDDRSYFDSAKGACEDFIDAILDSIIDENNIYVLESDIEKGIVTVKATFSKKLQSEDIMKIGEAARNSDSSTLEATYSKMKVEALDILIFNFSLD
jgi:hypothetical protein